MTDYTNYSGGGWWDSATGWDWSELSNQNVLGVRFYLVSVTDKSALIMYEGNSPVLGLQIAFDSDSVIVTGVEAGLAETATTVDATGNIIALDGGFQLDDTTTPQFLLKVHYTLTNPSIATVCFDDNYGASIAVGGGTDTIFGYGEQGELCATATIENTLPTVTLYGDASVTVDYAGSFSDPGATGSDAEDGNLTPVVTGSVDTSTAGVYTITYTVTDSEGAQASVDRTVTVSAPVDTTDPVITLSAPNPQPLAYGISWVDPGYSATDDTDGDLTSLVQVEGTVDEYSDGDYTITYTVSDSAGNTAAVTRTVQVQPQPDTNPPVITLIGDSSYTTPFDTPWSDPGYTASDAEDGDLTNSVTVGGDYVDYGVSGTYVVTYSVSDAAGNVGQASRTVVVEDAVSDASPVISITGKYEYSDPLMWEMGDAWVEPGVSATDVEDGSISVTTDLSGLQLNTPGTYYVNYSATDSDGNVTTAQRVVVVADNAAPVLTLIGDAAVVVSQSSSGTYTDLGATATDGGGDISDQIVLSGDIVDLSTVGTYTLKYNVSDANGNVAPEITRDVTVDAVFPTVTLIGSTPVMIEVYGGTWTDPGATAVDGEGNDLTSSIVVTDPVQADVVGTYVVIYEATNALGNSHSAQRTVQIDAHMCPMVEDLTLPAGSPNLSGIPVATNNTISYNGQPVDVSAYTSGNWESLAQNVGLPSGYISGSSLNVLAVSGVPLTDVSYWSAFPLTESESLNLEQFAGDRTFGVGVGNNVDGSEAATVETVIKFISYMGERRDHAPEILRKFEDLAALDYPFNWHCALDSKFSAQDTVLLASPTTGSKQLAEETGYPIEFVRFRLSEMRQRGIIDSHQYSLNMHGYDGTGTKDGTGKTYQPFELQTKSPKQFQKWSAATFDGNPAPVSAPTPDRSAPAVGIAPVNASPLYDLVQNRVVGANGNIVYKPEPDGSVAGTRTFRAPPRRTTVPESSADALRLSPEALRRALTYYLDGARMTETYLGGLYVDEQSGQNRQRALAVVVEVAQANGLDLSAYTG